MLHSRGLLQVSGKNVTKQKSTPPSAHVHDFIPHGLLATSKPGNRGLHRAGSLYPIRSTADVGCTDCVYPLPTSPTLSPLLCVCVCAVCNAQDSLYTLTTIAKNCHTQMPFISKSKSFSGMRKGAWLRI